jgi:glycosyltransferase involved in cell wall biosynthesis
MKGRKIPEKRKLFLIADCAVDTGFAQLSHNIINHLYKQWDIDVLAINYQGDPHFIQQKARLWNPAGVIQGDLYGISRIQTLISNINPEAILVINDPWIAAEYVPELNKVKGKKFLYTPVDAKHIKPMYVERINEGFDHLIAYTQFGLDELRASGLNIPASVIPHGVDTTVFYPMDKKEVRREAQIDENYFIVQMVDRNAPRKRLDLGMYYFSEWVKDKPENVMFYYHGALKDEGWDIGDLARYLGIDKRLVLSHQDLNPAHGFPLEAMKLVYNLADVKLSCATEGWGFTAMESMACGVPNIALAYSALGEWARGGIEYIQASDIPLFTSKGLNTRAALPDMQSTLNALEKLYNNAAYRLDLGRRGYNLVTQPQFEWSNIAKKFEDTFINATLKEPVDDDDN